MLLQCLPTRQRFISSSTHEYSYISINPTSIEKPMLLFLHGFPSHLSDWIHQFNHFTNHGYGVLIPDLLGYGESSKPTELNAYRLKSMSSELVELLDHVGAGRVVGIGHDFGSTLLSRFAAYHADKVIACVFLAVGPPKLGTPFIVDSINAMTREKMGYEMLGYIPFIARNTNAQTIMEKNAESVMSLLFCAEEDKEWRHHFRPLGAFAEFVSRASTARLGNWYPKELQDAHLEVFGCKDGYAGVIGWYKMWDQELFMQDEINFKDSRIQVPSLFIGSENESDMQVGMLREWVAMLQVATVKSGHWVHIEANMEVNRLMTTFLQEHVMG